jgi:uncharacterized protein with GYD domain
MRIEEVKEQWSSAAQRGPRRGRPGATAETQKGPTTKGNVMATFVTLMKFTDQGIRNAKDSPKRAEAFKNAAKQLKCTVKEILWTQGQFDVVVITEAPDDATATALLLSVGKLVR